MSAECGDAPPEPDCWGTWAAAHELPQELLRKLAGGVEQGWPPGMMDEDSLRILLDMGVKNTRYAEKTLSPYTSAFSVKPLHRRLLRPAPLTPRGSQLLQHAVELPRNDFLIKYRAVWPDSLADAALHACIQFVETVALPANRGEFQRRCRARQLRQLLLDRREFVSTQRKP
jgi:hypothetical protein